MECLDQMAIIVRTNLEARQYEALLKGKQFPVAGSVKKEQGVFQSEIAEDLYAFLRFLYEGDTGRISCALWISWNRILRERRLSQKL